MKSERVKKSPGDTLKINEIFYSIQGESTFSGLPCVFVRLTYCNLRCSYCDTTYAFFEGRTMTHDEIIDVIRQFDCRLIEITGGEPLLQKNVYPLMSELCNQGYKVLLETAGHMDISQVDRRVKRIMDIKCPSSGESEKIFWTNLTYLNADDEIKFVVGSAADLTWAAEVIKKHALTNICPVIFSPVFGSMENRRLAEWILSSRLPVRMQIQLHKQIWEPNEKGR
jgi:7-carboxy-7-deazaguanine synthase